MMNKFKRGTASLKNKARGFVGKMKSKEVKQQVAAKAKQSWRNFKSDLPITGKDMIGGLGWAAVTAGTSAVAITTGNPMAAGAAISNGIKGGQVAYHKYQEYKKNRAARLAFDNPNVPPPGQQALLKRRKYCQERFNSEDLVG